MNEKKYLTIDAKPNEVVFDSSKTAILIIDMQNDFCSDGGMFDLAGINLGQTKKVMHNIKEMLSEARWVGIKIVYIKHGFLPDLSDVGPVGSKNRTIHDTLNVGESYPPKGEVNECRILIRNTWNTMVVDELKPKESDFSLYKNRFSGFFNTELDEYLRKEGIENLVFTGTTASNCVESTLRDANYLNYNCLLLTDCVGEVMGDEVLNSSFLLVENLMGWISDSKSLINSFNN